MFLERKARIQLGRAIQKMIMAILNARLKITKENKLRDPGELEEECKEAIQADGELYRDFQEDEEEQLEKNRTEKVVRPAETLTGKREDVFPLHWWEPRLQKRITRPEAEPIHSDEEAEAAQRRRQSQISEEGIQSPEETPISALRASNLASIKRYMAARKKKEADPTPTIPVEATENAVVPAQAEEQHSRESDAEEEEKKASRRAIFKGKKKPKELKHWLHAANMFEPLWWYMQELRAIDEEKEPPPIEHDSAGATQTPWLYLALDFRFTTGIKLCQAIDDEEKISLAAQVRYFVLGFRAIYRFAEEKFKEKVCPQSHTLRNLGMPKTAALACRIVLLSPEKVNDAIHRLAIKMATDEHQTKSWRLMFQLPDIGAVQWTEYLSQAAKERAEEMKARAKPRARPNASVIIAATVFTAEEQEGFKDLPTRLKTREQKRILHNRQHVEKKWHCFKPFERPEATILECENCGEKVEFFRHAGAYACFDWRAGQYTCYGTVSKETELLLRRNAKYELHNQMAWNSGSSSSSRCIRDGPTLQKHLFYRATPSNIHLLGCRREGCEWNKRLAKQERIKTLKIRACYGEPLQEEKDGLAYSAQDCPC